MKTRLDIEAVVGVVAEVDVEQRTKHDDEMIAMGMNLLSLVGIPQNLMVAHLHVDADEVGDVFCSQDSHWAMQLLQLLLMG